MKQDKTESNIWYRITSEDGKVDAVVNAHESWLPYLWQQAMTYTYTLQEVPAKRALRLKKILDEKRRRTQGMCRYVLPMWLDITEPYMSRPKSAIRIYLLDSPGAGMSFIAKSSLINTLAAQERNLAMQQANFVTKRKLKNH